MASSYQIMMAAIVELLDRYTTDTPVRFVALPPFPEEFFSLPDEELGRVFWVWWVVYKLQGAHIWDEGIPVFAVPRWMLKHILPAAVEHIRIQMLQEFTGNEGNLGVERTLHLCASWKFADGGHMLRQVRTRRNSSKETSEKLAKYSKHQQLFASQPRPDYLQLVLIELVQANFKITPLEAIEELKRRVGLPGVEPRIDRVEGGKVWWVEPKKDVQSAPLSGLKDRLQSARDFVKKNQ
jgi:hypothetical protein